MQIDVQEFERFCLSKGDETFDYGSVCSCAVAQFLKSKGFDYVIVGPTEFYLDDGEHQIPEEIVVALRNVRLHHDYDPKRVPFVALAVEL